MKTYDILRIRIQRRKRALKCVLLGAVVLSLAGYALALANFWQGRHAEVNKIYNERHASLKIKGDEKGALSDSHVNVTDGLKIMALKDITDVADSEHDKLDMKTHQTEHEGDGREQEDMFKQKDRDINNKHNILDEPNKKDKPKMDLAGIVSQKAGNINIHLSDNETMATEMLKAEVEAKTMQIHLLSEPIVYTYNFEDIRNPVEACAVNKTQVLFVVPSAPENFQGRMNFRKGSVGEYIRKPSNNAKLLFFMGRPPCGNDAVKTQSKLSDEFRDHRDIVQENFEDVFKNVRLKAVSMLKWTVFFCKEAKYVIRIEDDVTVNIPKIVSIMETKIRQHFDFIIGDIKEGWKPVREGNVDYLKYVVTEEEYPEPTYPPFAVSGLMGYPLSTVSLLYQAALRVKPLWLDDVFLTGICAVKLHVPLLKDPDFMFHR